MPSRETVAYEHSRYAGEGVVIPWGKFARRPRSKLFRVSCETPLGDLEMAPSPHCRAEVLEGPLHSQQHPLRDAKVRHLGVGAPWSDWRGAPPTRLERISHHVAGKHMQGRA